MARVLRCREVSISKLLKRKKKGRKEKGKHTQREVACECLCP
jgi:hypothetical protein